MSNNKFSHCLSTHTVHKMYYRLLLHHCKQKKQKKKKNKLITIKRNKMSKR